MWQSWRENFAPTPPVVPTSGSSRSLSARRTRRALRGLANAPASYERAFGTGPPSRLVIGRVATWVFRGAYPPLPGLNVSAARRHCRRRAAPAGLGDQRANTGVTTRGG